MVSRALSHRLRAHHGLSCGISGGGHHWVHGRGVQNHDCQALALPLPRSQHCVSPRGVWHLACAGHGAHPVMGSVVGLRCTREGGCSWVVLGTRVLRCTTNEAAAGAGFDVPPAGRLGGVAMPCCPPPSPLAVRIHIDGAGRATNSVAPLKVVCMHAAVETAMATAWWVSITSETGLDARRGSGVWRPPLGGVQPSLCVGCAACPNQRLCGCVCVVCERVCPV